MHFSAVAPPRGERGLKYIPNPTESVLLHVAPPRGERGLKLLHVDDFVEVGESLPLVGSVD